MMAGTVKVFCDGGARGNPGPAASAFIVTGSGGNILARQGKYIGKTTNNIAEYTSVVLALGWLVENKHRADRAVFFLDSQLVVNQLTGRFKIKNKKLAELVFYIRTLEHQFPGSVVYLHIRRRQNRVADILVNKTLDNRPQLS